MSLELKIEALTAAVIALTAKMESGTVTPAAAPVAVKQVQVVAPLPVLEAAPAPAPVMAMPAPPAFMAAPVAAPTGNVVGTPAPFTDGKGLIDYVMGAYKALGATKGANIQGVLVGMGYQNINDVKPEHYAALFAGVEALK